jgi:outer membrane PBP1 activator LpoA protein
MRPLTRRLAPLLFLVAGVAAAQTQRAPGTAESLVSAAEQAIELGDDRQAESLLSRIPAGSLSPAQMARIQIVRAEIGVKRRSPEIVLRALPPSSERVPLFAPRIEQLRSRALFATGDPVGAVRSLVLREKYLNTPGAVAENQDLIWNGLILTPIPRSAMALVPAQDAVARGWIDLGLVLQQGPNDAALAAWQQRNPGHPGSTKLSLIRAGSTPAIAAAGPVAAQAGPALSGPPPDLTAAQAPAVGAGGYALLLPLGGADRKSVV